MLECIKTLQGKGTFEEDFSFVTDDGKSLYIDYWSYTDGYGRVVWDYDIIDGCCNSHYSEFCDSPEVEAALAEYAIDLIKTYENVEEVIT